jgi:hypothetical protein
MDHLLSFQPIMLLFFIFRAPIFAPAMGFWSRLGFSSVLHSNPERIEDVVAVGKERVSIAD